MKSPSIKDIEQKLDDYFENHPNLYPEHLEMVKGLGYKVLRNDRTGKHKIKIKSDAIKNFLGGAFSNWFGGD